MLINIILNNKEIFLIISIVSIITFIMSLIVIPIVILNMNPNYFSADKKVLFTYRHPFLRFLILLFKNILGYVLFILGIIMLFIPGQGLLSISLGIMLINFPGKKKVERKFFSNRKVNNFINIIRRKFHKEEIFFK